MRIFLDSVCSRCGARSSVEGLGKAMAAAVLKEHVCADGVRAPMGPVTERRVLGPGERTVRDLEGAMAGLTYDEQQTAHVQQLQRLLVQLQKDAIEATVIGAGAGDPLDDALANVRNSVARCGAAARIIAQNRVNEPIVPLRSGVDDEVAILRAILPTQPFKRGRQFEPRLVQLAREEGADVGAARVVADAMDRGDEEGLTTKLYGEE